MEFVSESVHDYVNRVGTDIAKEHYQSEILAKRATIQGIYSLYEPEESLDKEDIDRIDAINEVLKTLDAVIASINSMPYIERPDVIKPRRR